MALLKFSELARETQSQSLYRTHIEGFNNCDSFPAIADFGAP
jgi:hypothetical protein